MESERARLKIIAQLEGEGAPVARPRTGEKAVGRRGMGLGGRIKRPDYGWHSTLEKRNRTP